MHIAAARTSPTAVQYQYRILGVFVLDRVNSPGDQRVGRSGAGHKRGDAPRVVSFQKCCPWSAADFSRPECARGGSTPDDFRRVVELEERIYTRNVIGTPPCVLRLRSSTLATTEWHRCSSVCRLDRGPRSGSAHSPSGAHRLHFLCGLRRQRVSPPRDQLPLVVLGARRLAAAALAPTASRPPLDTSWGRSRAHTRPRGSGARAGVADQAWLGLIRAVRVRCRAVPPLVVSPGRARRGPRSAAAIVPAGRRSPTSRGHPPLGTRRHPRYGRTRD
jgi:hypothetical protein